MLRNNQEVVARVLTEKGRSTEGAEKGITGGGQEDIGGDYYGKEKR